MNILRTPAAAADLQISDYLQERHPRYRQSTLRKLYESILSLKERPFRGRVGQRETLTSVLQKGIVKGTALAVPLKPNHVGL